MRGIAGQVYTGTEGDYRADLHRDMRYGYRAATRDHMQFVVQQHLQHHSHTYRIVGTPNALLAKS